MLSIKRLCRKRNDFFDGIGLFFCFVSSLVASDRATFGTAVNYNVTVARVGFCRHRLHLTSAVRRSVARIHVKVKRPEAIRAVISGCISQGFNCFAAVGTGEALV